MTRRTVIKAAVGVAVVAGVGAVAVTFFVRGTGAHFQADAVAKPAVPAATRARAVVPVHPCATSVAGSGDARLNAVIAAWTRRHPATGVTIWRTSSAVTQCPVAVAGFDQGVPYLPASNQKLVTSAASLISLGSGYRYRTAVVVPPSATVSGGVLHGTVTMVGSGDPVFATTLYSRRYLGATGDTLEALAARVHAATVLHPAITRITGDLRANGSVFNAAEYPPDWTAADIGSIQPLSGVATNEDFAGTGQSATVANPVLAAAQRLRTALHGAHVATARTARVGAGAVPREATTIAAVVSPPVSRIVRIMNVPSDDFIAEQLVKTLGAAVRTPGTSAAGLVQVRRDMNALLGVQQPGDVIADGSGLARLDRETSRSLAWLMLDAQRIPSWGAPLIASLPAPGQGTLKHRLAGDAARVRAKTGTLNDVSTLTGIVRSRNGQTYTFSILCNGLKPKDITAAHAFQDALVARLVAGAAG